MDTAPRKETSKLGSSLVAISLAEYMDAPASDVTTHPRKQEFLESFFLSSSSSSTIMFKFEFATSVSVSLDAVPSPIAITETLYCSHTFLIFFFISISLCK